MSLLDLLYPKNCLGCGKTGGYICKNCIALVPKSFNVCPHCKNFSPDGGVHSYCKSKTSLDGVISIWRYEGVVKIALKKIKYNFNYDIAEDLVNYAKSVPTKDFSGFSACPVPLFEQRKRWRGFNQSEIFAQKLSKALNLGFYPNVVVKTKSTIPQARLHKNERLRSLSGVFAVNNEAKIIISGQKWLIIDDIMTTGSTLNELVKVLKKAGASEVWGLTLAR